MQSSKTPIPVPRQAAEPPPTFRPLDPSTQDWSLAQQLRDTLRIRRYIKNVEISDLLAKLNRIEELAGLELTS